MRHENEADPSSRRRGFLACLVTCHTVDYLSQPKKPRIIRKKFQEESPDFATVDRVGHALKHTKSGDDRSVIRPLKTEEVITRPPGFMVLRHMAGHNTAIPLGASRLRMNVSKIFWKS